MPLPYHPTRNARSRGVKADGDSRHHGTAGAVESLVDSTWISDSREALARVEEAAAEKHRRDAAAALDDGPQMNLFAGAKPAPDLAEVESLPIGIMLNESPQQKLAELPAADFEAMLIRRLRDVCGLSDAEYALAVASVADNGASAVA
jgi:hypothetical protein